MTALMLGAGTGRAATDHLECYKIKDPLALAAVVDLDSPLLGLAPGCKVSKAKMLCVAAAKTVVSAVNKQTGAAIVPVPLAAVPSSNDRICYKVKCPVPVAPIPDQDVTDQFGGRVVGKLKATMLCTPATAGGGFCGDGIIEAGEACEPTDLGGATCASAGFPHGGTIACASGCTLDTSGCRIAGLPLTGQTVSYTADKNDGIVGAVAVPDDGALEHGTPSSYLDNGDGTVTDRTTGLMWEKKSRDGGLHDRDGVYRWTGDGSQETIWDWLDDVNAEGGTGFAGHADWRMPNARELESILRYEGGTPAAVHPIFNTGCAVPGCTVLTCSCSTGLYWSSTTVAANPPIAWVVSYSLGGIIAGTKTTPNAVRAVRDAGS